MRTYDEMSNAVMLENCLFQHCSKYFVDMRMRTYDEMSNAVMLENCLFQHCSKLFIHCFACGTDISWTE